MKKMICFKDKDEVIEKAKKIIKKNKELFDLEDEEIHVVYERGDINNAFISKSLIGKNKLKVGISKMDLEYADKGLKLLLGHELTHAKFFKSQKEENTLKKLQEGLGLTLKLGGFLGKEVIIKRMILETLCDINAIKVMKADISEIEAYFNRGIVFIDKDYVISGYLPPDQRRLIAEKYGLKNKINKELFAIDFMKLYNKAVENSNVAKLKVENVDEIMEVIDRFFYEEFRIKEEYLKTYRF